MGCFRCQIFVGVRQEMVSGRVETKTKQLILFSPAVETFSMQDQQKLPVSIFPI